MFKCLLSAVMAALLLVGIGLDGTRWDGPATTVSPRPRLSTTGHFPNEVRTLYHFSGAADGVQLENGCIVLNDNVAGNDIEVFGGGALTVDAVDITAYSYEYNVTVEGDMVYVLDAGIVGDGTNTFGLINQPMSVSSAVTALYKDRAIRAEDLMKSLTFVLTLTHADGTMSVDIVPLTVTPASMQQHMHF